MNRRSFLGATAAGLGLATTPGWIRDAFAEPSSKSLVFDAYRRARRGRRALLVFVIPTNEEARELRGLALGTYITHATDKQLAPLARAEVVCATLEHLHQLVPDMPAGEPLAFLVDTTAVPATVHAITVEVQNPFAVDDIARQQTVSEDPGDRIAMANVARIADAFTAALGTADPGLAAKVRERISKRDVPGSRWASGAGCGTSYDFPEPNEPISMVGCGMGHVPEKATRFLELLAGA